MSAKRIAAMLALAAGCCSLDAGAFYFGLGAGQATDKEWDDRVIQDGSVGAIELEDSDTGFRLFGGFELDRGLAIELGYVNFGEQTAQGSADGSGPYWSGGPADVESGVDGLEFGLVGELPASDALSLIARVGVMSWESQLVYQDPTFYEKVVETGNDLFFGAGAEFHSLGPLSLRGEYTRYRMNDIDLDLASLSLVYRFEPVRWHGRHGRRGRR